MNRILDDADVAGRAAFVAGALAGRGLRHGDAVAALCGNGPWFVVARDAATAMGLGFVPVNPRLAPPEIEHVVAASGARGLVFERALAAQVGNLSLAVWTAELETLAAEGVRGPARADDAIGATILFTSGTTGRAKACLRTEAAEAARAHELIRSYALSPADVHLIVCPLAHSAPGIFLRAARLAGARTAILPRFDARGFLAAIAAVRASVFFLVPTQVERLLALPEAERRAADLSSVRAFIVAGAPFSLASKRRLLSWLGAGRLYEFYGSSETGTVTVLPPGAQPGDAGCVGWPPPGVELRLYTDAGAIARPGERGEVFVRSPALMAGYLGGAEATWRDGFLSVGDIGCLDADGALTLVDRKHDLIITGGVNVYPADVERALLEHPAVAAAVVCGLPDAEWGERVAALVSLREGGVAVAAAELREFLKQRVAAYKVPKVIQLVPLEELPLGASGKPLRRAARSKLAGRGGTE